MKYTFSILALSLAFLTFGCQNSDKAKNTSNESTDTTAIAKVDDHNSQNSLDWAGTYQDTIPCADCPGILTTVKLYDDGTYAYSAEYLERKSTVQDTGKFMWHNNGSVVHLKGKDLDTKYFVGENVLLQADNDGKVIEGDMKDQYSLHKIF